MHSTNSGSIVITSDILHQLALKTKSLFFIFDPSRKIFLYLSDYFSVYFGLNAAKVIENPKLLVPLILSEDKAYLLKKLNSIEPQLSIEVDFRLNVRGNSIRWLRCKAGKMGEEDLYNGCIIGYAEDITTRKEYELNLYNTHAQKDVALQILGHDLRAPITTIYAATSLMQRKVKEEDKQQTLPFFQIINNTCRNALNLIGEILNSAHWETQKTVPKKTKIDLTEIVENQINTYRLLHNDEKSFLLYPSKERLYVFSDPIRVQLVIENLLSNAYKFTKSNGQIEVYLTDNASSILMTISDDGIGIPEKLQPLIFQKFTKARRKGLLGEKSTGLGLHIVHNLVKQLSGKIWFSSIEDKGTNFYVELPKGDEAWETNFT